MRFLVAFALFVCVSADVSHVVNPDHSAPIIRSDSDVRADGFQFAYETGNGIVAQAEGYLKEPNSEYPYLGIRGGYRYTAPDGTPIELTYTADEEGYKPSGAHLPVPPEVPEAIRRSLAYIAARQ